MHIVMIGTIIGNSNTESKLSYIKSKSLYKQFLVSAIHSTNAGDIDPAAGPITRRLLVRLRDK